MSANPLPLPPTLSIQSRAPVDPRPDPRPRPAPQPLPRRGICRGLPLRPGVHGEREDHFEDLFALGDEFGERVGGGEGLPRDGTDEGRAEVGEHPLVVLLQDLQQAWCGSGVGFGFGFRFKVKNVHWMTHRHWVLGIGGRDVCRCGCS